MKLYGSYTSPFVRHCRIALKQAGHDFEFMETDYAGSAKQSPVAKVPFFEDGDLKLTDSSSIIKYARDKAGSPFLTEIEDFELFTMTNTLLDSTINLFLLENDGVSVAEVPYLARQQNRVESALAELNRRIDPAAAVITDSGLRCACFVDWGLYRKRISIDGLDRLSSLLATAQNDRIFAETAPPS